MSSNFASLHAGLVARKGEAIPAVSHPTFSYIDAPAPTPKQAPARPEVIEAQVPAPVAEAASPAPQPVTVEVAPTIRTPEAPRAVVQGRPVLAKKKSKDTARFRLTFRMTHDQRRRMRIAAAQKDQSLQHILSDAIDNYLDGLCACSLSECACMARDADRHK